MTDLDRFIVGLPRAELHIHTEGNLEPEPMVAPARLDRIDIPFASVEAVRAAYSFTRLQDVLDIYYRGADVLRTEEDFRDLAVAHFDRAAADGVVHAEIFFDPQTHVARGVAFDVVMRGLLAGMGEAKAKHGMSVVLILCVLRHLDEDDASAILIAAEPWLDRIAAVGLDSSELGHPPAKFARAGAAGLKRVAHAGEEGPPDYVWQALDALRIGRLDHGNRALENPLLVARLAREAMTLTACTLSNLKLRVVGDMADHPIDRMLAAGLRAAINSDDPVCFGGYIADNYRAAATGRSLGKAELAMLARKSFPGSFLPEVAVAAHLAALDAFIAERGRCPS